MEESPRAPEIGRRAQGRAEAKVRDDLPTSLVIGATGSFGAGVVQELIEQGRVVRALVRDNARAVKRFGAYTRANLVEGNVFDRASLRESAEGCGVIYHGVNLPLDRWERDAPAAMENVIGVAREVGATVVYPGNVWIYGPPSKRGGKGRVNEQTTPDPVAKKGRIKLEMEGMLRRACEDGEMRGLVVRGGDFFGPTVRNSYHDGIFGAAARGKPMLALGSMESPHQWAYMPDYARVCIKLAGAMGKLKPFETFCFAGHEFDTQRDFYDHVKICAEDVSLKVREMSWFTLRVASVVNKELREVIELRHLWDEGVLMDDARLRRVWPRLELTDTDEAISRAISSYR